MALPIENLRSGATVVRNPILSLAAAAALACLVASCEKPSGAQSQPNAPAASQSVYDTPINFGASGSSASYKVSGWSKAEEKFTWTEGNIAVLAIPLTATESPVTLRMTL